MNVHEHIWTATDSQPFSFYHRKAAEVDKNTALIRELFKSLSDSGLDRAVQWERVTDIPRGTLVRWKKLIDGKEKVPPLSVDNEDSVRAYLSTKKPQPVLTGGGDAAAVISEVRAFLDRLEKSLTTGARATDVSPDALDAHNPLLSQPAQPENQDRESDTPKRRRRKKGHLG
jgi:hypothetical protein